MRTNPKKAIEIIKFHSTEGSAPIEVKTADNDLYICKSTSKLIPRVEIINEVICHGLLQEWDLILPESSIITIEQQLIDNFIVEGNPLNPRYSKTNFNDELFFGSKRIVDSTELVNNAVQMKPSDFRNFSNPLDIIKIASFDFWVGNKDRKPQNTNIIISTNDDGFFNFIPIDHTAAFAYLTDYGQVRNVMLEIVGNNSILSLGIIKSIIKHSKPKEIDALKSEILNNINRSIKVIDEVFAMVPKEWGFSNKSKAHLKTFLADEDRNKHIAAKFFNFV
jgi:hypothetical protein